MEFKKNDDGSYTFPHPRNGDLTLHVRPTANAWWQDQFKVFILLDVLENRGTSIDVACYAAGITRRQYKYFAQEHPVVYERRREAKFSKRAQKVVRKRMALAKKVWNGGGRAAMRYLTFDDPEFDLRCRSDYARLRRIMGLPAHNPPPRTEEEKRRDMLAEVEKTRVMYGHPSDPKHYAQCSQCEHLLLPPSEWPEPYRSSYFQSTPQEQTPPGYTTAL